MRGKHANSSIFAWFKAPSTIAGTWTRYDINPSNPLRSFLGSCKLADFDNDGDLDLALSSDNHSGTTMAADTYVFVYGPHTIKVEKINSNWHRIDFVEYQSAGYVSVASGLPGQEPLNSFTDTVHGVESQGFYRIGVTPWLPWSSRVTRRPIVGGEQRTGEKLKALADCGVTLSPEATVDDPFICPPARNTRPPPSRNSFRRSVSRWSAIRSHQSAIAPDTPLGGLRHAPPQTSDLQPDLQPVAHFRESAVDTVQVLWIHSAMWTSHAASRSDPWIASGLLCGVLLQERREMATTLVTDLNVLALYVTDLARSETFYREHLGFEKVENMEPGILMKVGTVTLYLEATSNSKSELSFARRAKKPA